MANKETVNHPAHYGGDVRYEAIKVIEAWGLGFNLGQVLKYVRRFNTPKIVELVNIPIETAKALEDLKKARWYLDREIQRLENGSTIDGVTNTEKLKQ